MFKKVFYIVQVVFVMLLSCSGGSDEPINEEPKDIIPTNLVLQIAITGVDVSNLNGDGSGAITCTATATNAISYGFKVDSEVEVKNTLGSFNYTGTKEGLNDYIITVFAYSSTGNTISTFKRVSVFVTESGPKLVWSDEFNINGTPDATNWTYDLGAGGWGNQELQTYTNSSSNVNVTNGVLKITAIKDGTNYTSARLKTQGLYDFKYGRIDVKAKLPATLGTWPAIWMLGANINTVSWPTCGEIDIMEQTGADKSKTLGTFHWFNTAGSNNASYGLDKTISNAASEFHVYSLEWDASQLVILLDNVTVVTMTNNSSLPFYNKNFFFILNIALGGTLGGTIDPAFTQDTMEIDYIRVYQ